MESKYDACIEACYACAAECNRCATACLREDDVKMMARCIALDIDCAEICALAAAVMARGGEQVSALCRVCAEICEACGEECGRHQHDHCQRCAEACRRCARACRDMVAGA
ncbi:four-helix bundle copper-binding protein [Ramlibacter terrae]|uniref:Four-helix bundle copper-binding protein n=1 Tax=Ramlibacter terrae TaxID=2732511 RepID=A0ABX6P7P2_9BURK|nr:four-helix bundle copper-binding protein [Ramlibacter terrae]